MAEAYPYHPAEHSGKPTESTDVIRGELARCARQSDPLEGLTSLHYIYHPTPFGKDLARAAMFMRVAEIMLAPEGEERERTSQPSEGSRPFDVETAELNRDFYLGGLLALHANYRVMSPGLRLTVIQKEIFPKSGPDKQWTDPDDPRLMEASEKMDDFRRNTWLDVADALFEPEELEALIDIPTVLYAERQSSNGSQAVAEQPLDFMAGYTFGSYNVQAAVHSFGDIPISFAHYFPYNVPIV